jgi:hypothetical protein
MPDKNKLQEHKEALRKLIGSALCDFVAYLNSIKDPIIIGGQYSNKKLLAIFRDWLLIKKFEIDGVAEEGKSWIRMCKTGIFTGPKESVTPPKPADPAPTTPPKPPESSAPTPPVSSPTNDSSPNDDGFYTGDEWKSDGERPKSWTDEGEDWKDDNKKDGDQGKGFDGGNDFQPT